MSETLPTPEEQVLTLTRQFQAQARVTEKLSRTLEQVKRPKQLNLRRSLSRRLSRSRQTLLNRRRLLRQRSSSRGRRSSCWGRRSGSRERRSKRKGRPSGEQGEKIGLLEGEVMGLKETSSVASSITADCLSYVLIRREGDCICIFGRRCCCLK